MICKSYVCAVCSSKSPLKDYGSSVLDLTVVGGSLISSFPDK